MPAVFGHDIRATHKKGRKIRPITLHNERNPVRARADLKRIAAEYPEYRLVLIERLWTGEEREMGA
jgi:hypothetical protein